MTQNPVAILIPAYQPPESLPQLVNDIAASGHFRFVVVNDGSSEDRQALFDSLARRDDVTLLTHGANLGKGQALKTGINHILVEMPDAKGIVTADADGQHLPKDITKVAHALENQPDALCLGIRNFREDTPLRSRIGNGLTRTLFRVCSGKDIMDTQTGLRGLPIAFARQMLSVESDGYEFEFEALFGACNKNIPIVQVDIQTVYEMGNPTSHFNPFLDSLKIYFVFIRFLSSSFMASIIDTVTFSAFFFASDNLLQSMIAGRLCASLSQFFLSKHFVFNSKHGIFRELTRYTILVIFLATIAYNTIAMAVNAGVNTYLAKVVVEALLFFASFTVQRIFVFKKA